MIRNLLYIMSALIGIGLGILLHCSFMIVEAQGCYMLPSILPEQKVIVSLINEEINPEDVVAFYPPYYNLEGEGNIVFRRVEKVDGDTLILVCDAATTQREETRLSIDKVLGKAILLDEN